MKVSEQEIFDALTLYHKNDWKNGQYRGDEAFKLEGVIGIS